MSRAIQKQFNVYLLSNLATCDLCGRNLRAQGSKSEKYYREMSYERGYTDCPHQRIGLRTEVVEKQIHALIPMINLPREWLDDVENHLGDDEETIGLQRQRDRLDAELRRLQQMRLAGDFDENLDFYRAELSRIRRQLSSLPTYDQLTSLRSTMRSINDLYEIWEDAEPADQRDLLRLMLKEVSIDVRSGRITSISPLAVFLPTFRQIPVLHESEFGTFTPLWPLEQVAEVLPIPLLETIQAHPSKPIGLLPFSDRNPLQPPAGTRNAPSVSKALSRARESEPIYVVTQIETPGWQLLPMDMRKWQDVESEAISIDTYLKRAPLSSDVLASQGVLWENALSGSQLTEVFIESIGEKLSNHGVWYLTEPLPIDAPTHWLLRFFPAIGEWVKINAWNLYNLNAIFQRNGFSMEFYRVGYKNLTQTVLL